MNNNIILFLLIMTSSFCFSQEIRDKSNKEKIAFVEIYSDEAKLLGTTNADGFFSADLITKIKSSNTKKLTFINSFFESKIIKIDEFNADAVFYMSSVVNALSEVVVSPKNNNNQYLVLKTYIRSLQINNDKIQYLMDGIVEYYISLKTKKIKIKFISNRSFENKSIKQLKEKGLTKIYFQVVGAPMLNEFLNYRKLLENYNFQTTTQNFKITSKEDSSLKGNFVPTKNGCNLSLNFISTDKPKIMKGLGVENILENYTINSSFNTVNIEEIGFSSLLYFKETRNYKIKAKKDKEYQKVDATHEVFVLDYRYSEDIDAKNLDNNYSFIDSSKYSDEYWKKISNVLFQPLPSSLETYIKENLEVIK